MEELWAGVKADTCGIGPIAAYDASAQKVKLAAEVKGLDVAAKVGKAARKMDCFTQLALLAAREAYAQSGAGPENTDLTRAGVIFSSGIGGLPVIEQEHNRGMERGYDRVSPFFIPMCISNMAAGTIAIDLGLRGMCTCVVTACASGANAIGDAFRHIRDGYADLMVCGGAESAITPLAMGGFTSMKALCEAEDPARARGAVIYGKIVGYGATCDAYHMTAPAPDGEGAARCMAQALADGGAAVGGGGLYQRPRHLHPHERPVRDRRRQGCPGSPSPGDPRHLHQVHDRPPAGGQRRGGGHHHRPGPPGGLCPRHHRLPGARPRLRPGYFPGPGTGPGPGLRPVQLPGLWRPQRHPGLPPVQSIRR